MTHNFNDRYILNDQGEPEPCEDLMTWGTWLETSIDKRRVARDEVGEYKISTVFLSMDHDFSMSGIPVLWESMVFKDGSDVSDTEPDLDARRYSSKEDAIKGHKELVEIAKQKIK